MEGGMQGGRRAAGRCREGGGVEGRGEGFEGQAREREIIVFLELMQQFEINQFWEKEH